jgi:hypothetical protein
LGLNEFSGNVGVAIAGILTAHAAEWLGARTGLLVFGMAVVLLALLLTVVWVKDTLPWARADITPPAWRGSANGIYRFWRGLGYAIGALGLGLAASLTGAAEAALRFVALSVFASGAVLYWFGEETHPRLLPAREGATA